MNSNESVLCEKCGSVMENLDQGSTIGLICANCGWNVVTSKMADGKNYKIYLLSADPQNRKHIKAISVVANVNFLQAREISQKERVLIVEDRASAIDKVRKLFDECFIRYEIEPPFPY